VGVKQEWGGKQAIFEQNASVMKTVRPYDILLIITNRKLHMSFLLAPISMTLDDIETAVSSNFGVNFAGYHRFGKQELLNE